MADLHTTGEPSADARGLNRRVGLIAAGIIVNTCLGTVYSWSVFRAPLESLFGLTPTQSGLPYSIFLGVFAFTMPFAGSIISRIGSRLTLLLGGVLLAAGWVGAGLVNGLSAMILAYGVVGGIGVGFAYGVPLVVAGSWFPAHRGLAMGVTLAGFGVSPFLTAPLAEYLIGRVGVQSAMIVLGVLFLAVISLFVPALRRFGDRPLFTARSACTAQSRSAAQPDVALAAVSDGELTPAQMFRTPRFYGLWACFAFGTLAGLTAIGMTASFGQETAGLSAANAALAVSLFGIANGLGRPLFGAIIDAIGVRLTVIVSFVVIAAGALVSVFVHPTTPALFYLGFGIFWLMLGGWLALAPAATVRLFGARNYARNYGIMYTAYGVGALTGGFVSGVLHAEYGSFDPLFVFVLVLCALGVAVSIVTLPRR